MEAKKRLPINNTFYDDLREKWHEACDHPIALLRAENELRNPWIKTVIAEHYKGSAKVLDIGCGGGFLTNELALHGHEVWGIDLSLGSLETAKERDATKKVHYERASAYELPYERAQFDVVCAMDLLEHVEQPAQVIKEASRVLKPGGLFFFHTFNRNLLSYFLVIKGVEWCFAAAPPQMHVYSLFIKPKEMTEMCRAFGLKVEEIRGMSPDMTQSSFWKLLMTRKVHPSFKFVFTDSLRTGYVGYSKR